ncbi:MAG: formyl transferase [Deltaproteobacteria bacterium]|nr:formyl transferase [Deltaproteobacteria bacterium]
MLRPLHDPAGGPLRVVGLMSGSGSNLRRILEHRRALAAARGRAPFDVVAVFSDTWGSRATELGRDFDLPVLVRDIAAFYAARGAPRRDMALRAEFDAATVEALRPFAARAAAYAGYMSVATAPLIEAFLGVNVHPADLALEVGGRRRFTGDHAVREAILAGRPELRSTTHIIEPVVDGGRLLLISPPVPVVLPPGAELRDQAAVKRIAAEHQERLKEAGDWVVFPRTLEWLADGRIAQDEGGALHVDGTPIPRGWRMEG